MTERFETPTGQQAQFDWSPHTIELGGELMRVIVFGMVLGDSRRKHYTASLTRRRPRSMKRSRAAPRQLRSSAGIDSMPAVSVV